jgi:primosomal protein N' (replication factor Y)
MTRTATSGGRSPRPAYAGFVTRYASVYPLVPARALARIFTYEVPEGVEKGAVVEVRFSHAKARGVVVDVNGRAPEGIEVAPIERVVEELPPALIDLALWLAEYYGSTPGRTLPLVAPRVRRRRKDSPIPLLREGLAGEPEPERLTDEQREAIDRITGALGSGGNFLLYGATGSGKTEVYLQACAATLDRGLGAIVLVPEIALTPQAAGRFAARFGEGLAILHSGLTDAERRDERERIASGEARIVVGARSAIFAPVRDLGLICVDEEQDASYKQESDPRYDARTVAAKRAALESAVAVYGSATPRPESWERLERLDLGGRLVGSLPPVRVVDLRREAGYPLSAPLLAALGRVGEEGGKAILLLNRRGIAPALHCRACGTTLRCPNCDVALVLHRDERLHCHHCGHTAPSPETCPACGSPELARIGAGTEKLERELAERVPALERIRLDADVVEERGGVPEALRRFAATDRAVLLGTQMVAKGHHFAGVALAAVVDADTQLSLPDFRAEERTFQLLTQLAGRSGRDAPGRVIVQTFQPDARAVAYAARHDVAGFLAGELERRRVLGYPPFRHLVRVVVAGPDAEVPLTALRELAAGLEGADLLGPAPLLRLRGRYRAQLIAKTDEPRRVASRAGRLLAAAAPAMRRAGLSVVVDVDPQSL